MKSNRAKSNSENLFWLVSIKVPFHVLLVALPRMTRALILMKIHENSTKSEKSGKRNEKLFVFAILFPRLFIILFLYDNIFPFRLPHSVFCHNTIAMLFFF